MRGLQAIFWLRLHSCDGLANTFTNRTKCHSQFLLVWVIGGGGYAVQVTGQRNCPLARMHCERTSSSQFADKQPKFEYHIISSDWLSFTAHVQFVVGSEDEYAEFVVQHRGFEGFKCCVSKREYRALIPHYGFEIVFEQGLQFVSNWKAF